MKLSISHKMSWVVACLIKALFSFTYRWEPTWPLQHPPTAIQQRPSGPMLKSDGYCINGLRLQRHLFVILVSGLHSAFWLQPRMCQKGVARVCWSGRWRWIWVLWGVHAWYDGHQWRAIPLGWHPIANIHSTRTIWHRTYAKPYLLVGQGYRKVLLHC